MGAVFVDTLSGEVLTRKLNKYGIFDLITRFQPKEVTLYLTKDWEPELLQKITNIPHVEVVKVPYFYDEMRSVIEEHKTTHFKGQLAPYSVIAAHYFMLSKLNEIQPTHVTLRPVHYTEDRNYLYLHQSAITGLELLENAQTRKKEKSLFGLLDRCMTAKGSRLLKKWIQEPLVTEEEIKKRYSLVDFFIKNKELRIALREILAKSTDIERMIARFETGKYKDKELLSFLNTLEVYQSFFTTVEQMATVETLKKIGKKSLDKLNPMVEDLQRKIGFDHFIAEGYDSRFDKVRENKRTGLYQMEAYLAEEKEKTGLKTMKLEQNKVLGYFFEVTKSGYSKVPDYFVEKKELSNKKQFVTEKLVKLEEQYLEAVESYDELHKQLIRQIVLEIHQYHGMIRKLMDIVSLLDILMGFSELAEEKRYKRPQLSNTEGIKIENGLHPLLQAFSYQPTVANDCQLLSQDIQVVTGPNMGGKSTYLKMVALQVIMAQIGSFVPSELSFQPVDRVLLRMGANDSMLNHQSTFMVEMEEVAYILYHATKDSLILMDELGRGTSTSDGISIAHAVISHIHEHIQAKTICSTHYHELIALEQELTHVQNYHAEAKQTDDALELTFKMKKGGSSKSFGIEVAKRVGLPQSIIDNASSLLTEKYQDK
jgi:DNA mismatch repair protein MutS